MPMSLIKTQKTHHTRLLLLPGVTGRPEGSFARRRICVCPWGRATFTQRCHSLVSSSPYQMAAGREEGEGSVGVPGRGGAQPLPRCSLRGK